MIINIIIHLIIISSTIILLVLLIYKLQELRFRPPSDPMAPVESLAQNTAIQLVVIPRPNSFKNCPKADIRSYFWDLPTYHVKNLEGGYPQLFLVGFVP